MKSALIIGYLDDLTAGGDQQVAASDYLTLQKMASEMGLKLNVAKCEVITKDQLALGHSFSGFNLLSPCEGTLLGAPLLDGSAMNQALEARCSDLNRALDRFPLISAHDGLVILKNSISAPKLMYTLRCSPAFGHCLLDDFDQSLRLGLSRLANVQVDDLNWVQASLPVKDGGLGIRSVGLLAPSAFLASAAATQDLQAQLLPVDCPCDPNLDSALDVWSGRYGSSEPQGTDRSKQRCWDQASVDHGLKVLESHHSDPYHKARLLASRNPDGGHWLHAWPISACGLRLDDEAVRVAIGLRLGIDLCEEHDCPCGLKVDRGGSHGLSCRRGPGRIPRHDAINDIVYRALLKAQIPSQKEPRGLTRDGSDKRVDGCTLIPWQRGRSITWDVTIPDTLANSHLPRTSAVSGAAAEEASLRKISKYTGVRQRYDFVAIAVESLGPINEDGSIFLREIGKRLTTISGDPRETSFLLQRISVTLQRYNAVAFRGSFQEVSGLTD